MPPRPKFSREEIVEAALAVVSDGGIEALTARTLAKRLGCSTRPIFTVFNEMDEIKTELRTLAAARIEERSVWAMERSGSVIQAGVQIMRIAIEDPNLYKLVFMSDGEGLESFDDFLGTDSEKIQRYKDSVCDEYELTPETAQAVMRYTFAHFYGIGALCVIGRYAPSDEELTRVFSEEFQALSALAKAGGLHVDEPEEAIVESGGDGRGAQRERSQ